MGHLSGALDRASEETMGTTSAPTMRLRSAFLLGKRIETLALEHSHGETPRFSSLMQSLNVIYRAESFPLVFFFWGLFWEDEANVEILAERERGARVADGRWRSC